MKKMLFILNPCAGTRKANKVLADILAVFNRADYDVRVYVTGGRRDATAAVEKFGAGMDLIVCSGGDGTLNEVITGILKTGLCVPIGYICAGSTNDFASSLNLATDPVAAAQQIVEGCVHSVDVGLFADRYFSYVASFGAFTKTSYSTPQSVKNALGHTAYLLEGIKDLTQIHKIQVRMELDDGTVLEDDYLFGAVCNSTSVGGILKLDPNQVDMCDGLFEVLLVRAPKNLAEITECIGAIRRQQYNCRMMTFCSAKEIKIFSQNNIDWSLDGELAAGSNEITVTNLHHAIHLLR